MPARWDWPYEGPIALEVPVRPIDWKPDVPQALPPAPVAGGKREIVRLVPYGCTKFHISMFPVTPHAWEGEAPPVVSGGPELMGNAGYYADHAVRGGRAIGSIDRPGSGAVWRESDAGKEIRIRYAALTPAQLTLTINDGKPRKFACPATGKWKGSGAYSEVVLAADVPPHATVRISFEPGDSAANIESVKILP
jgi:hypothetical protein